MTPAKEVGGDLYGYHLEGDKLYFALGDVSGKGVPASLFMAQATRLFLTHATQGMMPAEICTSINKALAGEDNVNAMFVTMFIGLLDLKTGHLDFCNAGHNAPVLGGGELGGEFLDMLPNAPIGLWPGLEYEGEELDRIYYTALLHDCGKIGVPDNILGKPGKLTDEEFKIIKSHTVRGGEILDHFKSLEGVNEGALYHHERYDGKGYPKGLAGKEIPLIARIICVADSFDTMNSNRVYRKKLTKECIINEIETNKGRQFDPEIADVMLKLLHSSNSLFDL
jgi:hypothetical protein